MRDDRVVRGDRHLRAGFVGATLAHLTEILQDPTVGVLSRAAAFLMFASPGACPLSVFCVLEYNLSSTTGGAPERQPSAGVSRGPDLQDGSERKSPHLYYGDVFVRVRGDSPCRQLRT